MDNLSAVESIFFAALDKASPEERAAYLDQECGKEGELREHVERLLSAHPKVGGFLQAATVDEPALTERPGTVIGPYKLMEQIGEGGMGLVFVAEQQHPVRRKVALKVIKPGMDTRDVIARFEAERQALALMDHPNIAKVLDAGATESGRPYFVMELVRGVPITDFCDRNQLTPCERLGLFVTVCQAVQHAHSKGVIHRDIKPSNVLVTLHDATPVVKVIDFGVAKAIGQSLTDKTVYTRFAQMIGTPLYMSPEQAEMAGLDVDTRCDVYALGVLLYELLTGTTPFDGQRLQKAAFDEVRRILREEEPPKPSTRLTTLGKGLSEVSARRKTQPKALSALVKGDLDWIVMKALEKDRNRRYETASALAADVRRHLAQEPVEARPPSALYRFSKMARRNRVALTTAAVVSAALVAGIAVSSWEAAAAWRAEGEAQDAKEKALTAKAESDDNARLANERKDQLGAANRDLRRALYGADMTLIPAAWEADDLSRFDRLMRGHAGPDEAETRGFEWYYWNRWRHGELRTVALAGGFEDSVVLTDAAAGFQMRTVARTIGFQGCQDAVFSPDGKWFAAVTAADGAGEFRLWETATGALRQTLLRIPFNWYQSGRSADDPKKPGLGPERVKRRYVRMAFSPDGRRVALSQGLFWKAANPAQPMFKYILEDGNREIYVWDTDKGTELCHLTVPEGGWSDAVALGPEGKLLAFVSPPPPGQPPSGNVRIWDVDAGKEAFTLSTPVTPRELAFSPDGGRIAVALSQEGGERFPDDQNQVQIWDTAARKDPRTIRNGGALPSGVAFSPDGTRLAVVWHGPKDQTLALYDAGTGKEARALDGVVKTDGRSRPRPVFSADGRRLTCPVSGSLVQVWDAGQGAVLFTARGHAGTPAVGFGGGGTRLLTAGWDGPVKEWAEPAPRPVPDGIQMSGAFSPLAYAYTPNGLRLARGFTVGEGNKKSLEVRIWDEKGGPFRVPIKVDLHADNLDRLLFNRDGTRLAAQYGTNSSISLRVWDAENGKELFTTARDNPFGSLLAFSPDGSRVAWCLGVDMGVQDVGTGRVLLDIAKHPAYFAAFNADGSRIAWRNIVQHVNVWDVDPAKEVLTTPELGGEVGQMVFSPDGTRLAAPVSPGEVRVWDADGREVLSLKVQGSVHDIAFSPDGRRVVTYFWRHDNDGDHPAVIVWDAVSGLPLLQLSVPDRSMETAHRLLFQPDGRRLFLVNLYPQNGRDAYQVWDATPTAADGQRP